MPTYIRSGSWKQVKEIYVRVGNAWKTVNSAWVRVGNVWKQVHNVVETPYPSGDITVRNSLNDIIDNSTYLANVGDTIYGNRGPTWLNNPTAFQYRWRYSTESGGPYQNFSPAETSTSHPSPLNTASPISRINDWDGRWIVYEVRAQNALGFSEWFTSINEAHLVKYKPVNRSISITGTPGPFSTLTAKNVWQTTLINTGDWAPSTFEYNWYDNTTNDLIFTDTVRTFTPTIEDLNRYVRVEVTATNTGGSTTAVSAAVGPIEFVLAVEPPTVAQDGGDIVLDNRGGIINGVLAKVSTTIYGVTAYTSYRVRYRYRNVQTGTYLLYGASSTATASWVTVTSNASGFGDIYSVIVDDVNRVTTLYDLFYINEVHYDGSTYTAGSVTNGAKYQVEIQVSVIRPDNSAVSRTLTYGISAAPVPTITTASTTVGTNRDIVFTGTVGGLAGKPAYPTEYFLDFGDSSAIYTELFSEGARNPTYSITHQYEDAGSYTAEVSTNPPFTSATKAITVVLAPGSFNIISVVKGLSNGTTRPLTVTWEQSVNATMYEIQVQRQYSDLSGWVTVQTFADSIYTSEPTRTRTLFISPVAKYYRASVRATRYTDLDTAAYSGNGTLANPVYVEAEGIPASAPRSLVASDIRTTSATISFTAPTSFGSAGLNTYQWSLDNITWNSTFSSTSPAYVYGLTADTSTTVYIRALNLDDVGGTPASIIFTTAAGPKPFNIISATKGIYDPNLARSIGAGNSYPGNGARAITINWSQSLDATQYEVQIEARDYDPIVFPGASQTWVMLRSLALAPYVNEPTRTETFNAAWYWQYRVTVRARTGGNLASAAYSDGGSSTSLVYFDVTGTAPEKPTIGTITPTKNSASVAFTNSTSTGSSDLAFSQWSRDQVNWTRVDTSPFTISNLESSFFYTVYMRSFNYDGISSATPHAFKSFTTPAAKPPNTPTSPTTSGVTTTNITFSWTAPSTDSTHGAATSYIYYTNTTGSTPSSGGTSVSAPTTSINFTYTASASPVTQYFWVRAVNDDGESSLTSVVSATPSGLPSNSVAPGISTDTGNYSAGSIITGTTGTWSNAASYLIQIVRSTSTPITSDSALVSNVYTITDTDAADPSFYFAVKVTAYSGAGQTGSSVVAYSATSPISTLVPTVSTPTVGGATKNGFTVTWTSGPLNQHTSNVQIYNSSQTLVTTISSVTSPYVWTGGSISTTYYAKVRVIAQDTSATSITSGFSSSITTLANAPTISVAPTITPTSGIAGTTTFTVNSNGTWLNSPTSYSYQWQYYSGIAQNISGATSSTYSPPSDYVTLYGSDLRCLVTASNTGGSNSSPSNVATVLVPKPSGGTVSISTNTGDYKVGSVITYSTTGWSPAPSGYSLRLYNGTNPVLTSDPLRASTTSASGTYTIAAGDIPNFFKAFATATNTTGTSDEVSSTQVGPAVVGDALTPSFSTPLSTTGGFSGSVTNYDAAYTWNTPSVVAGTLTAGTFTWSTPSGQFRFFTVNGLSSGQSSTVTVTTTRSGYASGSNSTTGTANTLAPVNTVAPTITPASGRAGTATYSVDSTGTWDNTPTSFSYQWQSFDQGSVYVNIAGETSSSYSPPSNFFSSKISPIRCRVTAINAGGSATASSNTAAVTPITVPGQVTGVTTTVTSINRPYNNGEIGVSWTAPADDGGSVITGYRVEYSSNGGTSWSTLSANWTSGTSLGSSPWSVATYVFRVSAINAIGTGTASANSNNAVVTTIPEAPTIGTATAGNGSATVAYTAGGTGGKTVTYTATSSPGGFTGTGASPITVSGLTNGTAYTFTVKATNDNGTSNSSSASNSVTPSLSSLTTNPAYGAATSTAGGWTALITTAPNPTGGNYSYVSATVGSASVNSSTGALTASGLTASQSSTVTVRYSLSGYNSVDITKTGSASAPVYAAVVWGAMTAPAFARSGGNGGSTSTSYRWGWNNQLPTSGDYNAADIRWEFQFSTTNTVTNQTGAVTGSKARRTGGGLTVGASAFDNRVSSLSGDYNTTTNIASAGEPVAFSTSPRYVRYRGSVVGLNGTTYVSNYSAWT